VYLRAGFGKFSDCGNNYHLVNPFLVPKFTYDLCVQYVRICHRFQPVMLIIIGVINRLMGSVRTYDSIGIVTCNRTSLYGSCVFAVLIRIILFM
jgi:hypothetical protein